MKTNDSRDEKHKKNTITSFGVVQHCTTMKNKNAHTHTHTINNNYNKNNGGNKK